MNANGDGQKQPELSNDGNDDPKFKEAMEEITSVIRGDKKVRAALLQTPYDQDNLMTELSKIRDEGYRITM